ncbi:MAG TPA: bpX6 domain-containing protein [Kofleriaceae bacterium]|nr:bpX6 domain-containing protein [Kofleriaceae bacterium]
MIAPRRHAHRGSVRAIGFVIDVGLVGLAEARRRVLAVWRPGAVVHDQRGALIVTGLPVTRVRAQQAPGAPIVDQHGVPATLPLDADEAAQLAGPGAIAVAEAGAAVRWPLPPDQAVDVAGWIDLEAFAITEVAALAAPPIAVEVPAAEPSDLRVLTGVAAADADAVELAGALAQVRAGAAVPRAPSRWRRLVRWLLERLASREPAGATPDGAARAGGADDAAGAAGVAALARRSWLDRLRGWIAGALWRSRLGALLGQRHADYLRRLLELFDRGDLDEALRRAIPIGGDGERDAPPPSLGLPRPRDDLRLRLEPRREHGSAIPVGASALEVIRNRYRAAAERLERADRIDEAAFVFAELLGDVEAAIALLERHRRFALAARLAEARGLPPGLVVRLWFLARDRQRAIDCARRHRAWGDAIARLERDGSDRAAALRLMWADHLADTGDFAQAVDVAWPVAAARRLIEAWIDRGIAAGAPAARLLVKKLVVAPAALPAIAPAIRRMLDDRDPDAPRWRQLLIEELVAAPRSAELRALARPAFRALVRDSAERYVVGGDVLHRRLLELADDAALRADQPAIPTPTEPAWPASVTATGFELDWAAGDAGALPVHDAAELPDGRLVIALGEIGVRIVGRDGRTTAHIDQPAFQLVMSDLGTRALAVAPRGQVQRIARLDLLERRGAHWCDVMFDSAARSFDGDVWIAALGRGVVAVDTTAPRWHPSWGVEVDGPAHRVQVRRDGEWFAVEALAAGHGELWHYQGLTLRRRRDEPPGDAQLVAARPSEQDWLAVFPDGALRGPDWEIPLDPAPATAPAIALEVHGDLAAVAQRAPAGVVVTVVFPHARRRIARLVLHGATAVSLRLGGAWTLTIGDDRGRLISVDLLRAVLRRDLRIS